MPRPKACAALLERIAQVARRQFGEEGHLIATTESGSRLLEEHLEFLKGFEPERMADVEEVRVLLEISRLVDCVQDGTSRFAGPERTRGFLSDRYREIVENLEFASASVDPDLRQRYEQAERVLYIDPPFLKTEEYEEFCILRTDIEQKEVSLLEIRRQLASTTDATEKERLTLEAAELESLVKEQRDVLEGWDRTYSFTLAEEIKDSIARKSSGLPQSVQDALKAFDLFKITDAISNESHVMCSFFPSHLSEDNWTLVRLNQEDIEGFDEDNPQVELLPESSGFTFPADAQIDLVEAEIQILSVQRPWFWHELFENRSWRWKSPSGPVSEGLPNDRGLIPAYVVGLIVARNLMVRGRTEAVPLAPGPTRFGNLLAVSKRLVAPVVTPATVTRRERVMVRAPFVLAPLRAPADRSTANTRPLSEIVRFASRFRARMPVSRQLTTLSGRVTDEAGAPASGAVVHLQKQPSGSSQKKLTSSRGEFSFGLAAKGQYTLTVSRPGYVTFRQSVLIEQDKTCTVQLRALATMAPALVVRLKTKAGEPFEGTTEILINRVGDALRRTHKIEGASEVRIPLPPGRYDIRVFARGARRVEPAQTIVDLSRETVITFQIDTGVILHNPDTYLVGFVCRRVSKSPDPDPGLQW